ncbi:MAG TPA: hypothetical protein H9695_09560 [Candidatus Mediterraneibacter excrementigallinarum]|nr:hypothetical protein [Candidatus Mediterraneibacter excrementigallinarum]
MKRKLISAITLLGMCSLIFTNTAYAKENMVPDYEMKFLLDSGKVLNDDYKLDSEYRDFFDTGKKYETVGVLYLETEDYDFSNEGWYNRIRIKEDSDKFDLTYKKRYSIENGDIEAALTKANEEGFDISDTNYEAQVDWGYNKMTLSLSNKKTEKNNGYDDMELPGRKDAIEIIKDNMPGKEKDWKEKNWGKDLIDDVKKCGPVYYSKYEGEIEGITVDIEVWPVYTESTDSTEYITEVSFKEDEYDEAASNRNKVMDALEDKGILKHEDSLKTQKNLEAYLQ